MDLLVAGLVAAGLTVLDMDRVFYIPQTTQRKVVLYGWWLGFVLANAVLAAGAAAVLAGVAPLKDWDAIIRGLAVGLSYLALIRLKFSSFTVGDKEVPLGIEAVYDAAKQFFFRRINSIAKKARITEATDLANSKSLADLGEQARASIELDALLSAADKEAAKQWVLRVIQEQTTSELLKKITLADFILSGRRPASL